MALCYYSYISENTNGTRRIPEAVLEINNS